MTAGIRNLLLIALALALAVTPVRASEPPVVERVTTAVPFPRGLTVVGDELYVLCRGRVRGAGGVSAAVDDRAGTIYAVDQAVAEPASGPVGPAVRTNARLVAVPTSPPFVLWDRAADPPHADRRTDRPYCTLRFHAPSRNLFLCAFSGVDKPQTADDPVAFSKNLNDAVLRYDLRSETWHEVERHDIESGGAYPHHDPQYASPPHGLVNGPDNCLPLGNWLYVAAKDNNVLARYDLRDIAAAPGAPPPHGEIVPLDDPRLTGHSALAYYDGWLYVAGRTSSVIVRLRLDERFEPVLPVRAELVARFDPFDPRTHASADITDLTFDDAGRLYAVSAKPARVYRFAPDPGNVFDARDGAETPWLDLAAAVGNKRTKSENVLYHDGYVYVTSGDGYAYQDGAWGTVYRVRVSDLAVGQEPKANSQ